MLGRLAGGAFKRRRSVLLGWLAVVAIAVVASMTWGGEYGVDYATPGSESAAAAETLAEEFDGRSAATVEVVYTSDTSVTDEAVTGPVDELLARAGELEGLTGGMMTQDAEVSPDGRTAIVTVPLDRPEDTVPTTTGETLLSMAQASHHLDAVGGHRRHRRRPGRRGRADLVRARRPRRGDGGAAAHLRRHHRRRRPAADRAGGRRHLRRAHRVLAAALDTPDWALQVSIMIGLGVGIDYALLILTRQRAALAQGLTPYRATVEAMSTAGRSVVIAGTTVVISMLGLFLMGFPYLYGVALAASLAVLLVMAANLTLLPGMLGFAGKSINRLRIPGLGRVAADPDRSRPARWARGVQRRPRIAVVASLALLVAMTAPLTGIRFGFPDAGNEPASSTVRAAYDMVSEGFGPGATGPLVAVVATPDEAAEARLATLTGQLEETPGVAAVSPAQGSQAGTTSLVAITPTTSPQDAATNQLIDRLRDGPLAASGLDVDLGGQTAATVDQGTATASRLPLFIGGVIGLSILLLVLAFRAPIVAVKAGVLNLLSIGAAYGVVSLVAEGGWAGQLVGIDTELPVPPFIPVMMFAVLFGLSMDYEVFLMSRIKEELARGGDARMAVVAGVARTAKVITAAAAIMVAIFAAFALSPMIFLKLIGIGLATAILVDATIVRMILVPAIMELLGDRAWWAPRWLERLIPEVDVEGGPPRPAVA